KIIMRGDRRDIASSAEWPLFAADVSEAGPRVNGRRTIRYRFATTRAVAVSRDVASNRLMISPASPLSTSMFRTFVETCTVTSLLLIVVRALTVYTFSRFCTENVETWQAGSS